MFCQRTQLAEIKNLHFKEFVSKSRSSRFFMIVAVSTRQCRGDDVISISLFRWNIVISIVCQILIYVSSWNPQQD